MGVVTGSYLAGIDTSSIVSWTLQSLVQREDDIIKAERVGGIWPILVGVNGYVDQIDDFLFTIAPNFIYVSCHSTGI